MSNNRGTVSPLLSVHGLSLAQGAPPFDVDFYEAEIVGLAGLEGHGQQLFLEVLCGLRKPLSGTVNVHLSAGHTVTVHDLRSAVRAGLAYLPRERKTQGIFPSLSVLDNFAIATLGRTARLGFINGQVHRQQLQAFRDKLSMVYASPQAPITSLSGGNQQKLLLARWLAASPRIMLLNDPTRGVDVQTKMTLYDVFDDMVENERKTLIMLSTEIDELIRLCHRTLVFRDAALFAELPRETITRAKVIAAMFGRAYAQE